MPQQALHAEPAVALLLLLLLGVVAGHAHRAQRLPALAVAGVRHDGVLRMLAARHHPLPAPLSPHQNPQARSRPSAEAEREVEWKAWRGPSAQPCRGSERGR